MSVPSATTTARPATAARWSRREVAGAAWLALLAGSAAALAPRRGRPAGALAQLIPAHVGPWRASATPADVVPQLTEPSDTDQTLARVYLAQGEPAVMLAAAYHPPLADGSRVHRPEVCYRVAGFRIVREAPVAVRLSDRCTVAGNLFVAERGERRELALYWTRVGPAFPTDIGAQRLATVRQSLQGHAADSLLMRLSLIGTSLEAEARLADFAALLFGGCDVAGRRLLAGASAA